MSSSPSPHQAVSPPTQPLDATSSSYSKLSVSPLLVLARGVSSGSPKSSPASVKQKGSGRGEDGTKRKKLIRASVACEQVCSSALVPGQSYPAAAQCRRLKQKCEGCRRPGTCQDCKDTGKTCEWPEEDRRSSLARKRAKSGLTTASLAPIQIPDGGRNLRAGKAAAAAETEPLGPSGSMLVKPRGLELPVCPSELSAWTPISSLPSATSTSLETPWRSSFSPSVHLLSTCDSGLGSPYDNDQQYPSVAPYPQPVDRPVVARPLRTASVSRSHFGDLPEVAEQRDELKVIKVEEHLLMAFSTQLGALFPSIHVRDLLAPQSPQSLFLLDAIYSLTARFSTRPADIPPSVYNIPPFSYGAEYYSRARARATGMYSNLTWETVLGFVLLAYAAHGDWRGE
ncbi:hypothetical protein P7C73_g5672, partial [Tremellales sp. Uapishka_1]